MQLAYRALRQVNEITLVTPDRPGLFADMAGVLSAWGMNIVKADAFSNAAGIIVDTFQFTDTYRTLELNASEDRPLSREHPRRRRTHKVSVEELLRARKLKPVAPESHRRNSPRIRQRSLVAQHAAADRHPGYARSAARDRPQLRLLRLQHRSRAHRHRRRSGHRRFLSHDLRPQARRIRSGLAQRLTRPSAGPTPAMSPDFRVRRHWACAPGSISQPPAVFPKCGKFVKRQAQKPK